MALKFKYFVLKPAGHSKHSYASREAMRTYAVFIREHDPELANELIAWTVYEEGLLTINEKGGNHD